MTLKILSSLIMFFSILPAHGEEPTNAIKWFDKETAEILSAEQLQKNKNLIIKESIEKSDLKPNNLNSVGIIPPKITKIDPAIWQDIDERILFHRLASLPNLNFHSAQTFLKRILISETQPPRNSTKFEESGKYYLLAKLDKLIEFGAVDEAETLILQISNIDKILFQRWLQIAFLTGRTLNLCKTLSDRPSLSNNLSVRIICFKHLDDWQAGALTLSAAASLNLLDQNREKLLIHYLDPSLIPKDELLADFKKFDEIDHYLMYFANRTRAPTKKELKYLYMDLRKSGNDATRLIAAEELAIKKSIGTSTLFDLYRNTNIAGSNDFWRRIIAIKNLDLTLKKDNQKMLEFALNQAIKAMFDGNLLTPFAVEYANRLSHQLYQPNDETFNDYYAMIFALNGEIPSGWRGYEPEDQYIQLAFKILNSKRLTNSLIKETISSINPKLSKELCAKEPKNLFLENTEDEVKSKGLIVLESLNKSALGITTSPEDLCSSMLMLLNVNEPDLVKAMLIEYLIQFYGITLKT